MTSDDDAFIRGILANPNDDLPRLVYADWLDDRDDPRGLYVREELELAKTGESGSMYALRLAGLSRNIDDVWLSRVSRPPAGVCCSHVTIGTLGKPLTPQDVRTCALRLHTSFPPDVVAFLANHNGGRPHPPWHFSERPVTRRMVPTVTIEQFLPATRESVPSRFPLVMPSETIDILLPALHGPAPIEYVPIAQTDHGLLIVGVKNRRMGKVYAINGSTLATSGVPRKLADSLPNFLDGLRTNPPSYP